jgi:hypothetical protein
MTLKKAITRWDKYLNQITDMIDTLSYDIQNRNFVDSNDATALICLHSQLCTARATAMLGGNLMKTVQEEIKKAGVKNNE